jgi:hypothetical protein
MEFYSKRLLKKGSPVAGEPFGCSRKALGLAEKVSGLPDSTSVENYSKRLLENASPCAGEPFGCSRKLPGLAEKLSGRNYSTLMEIYSKRLLMKGSSKVEEPFGFTVKASNCLIIHYSIIYYLAQRSSKALVSAIAGGMALLPPLFTLNFPLLAQSATEAKARQLSIIHYQLSTLQYLVSSI